MKLSELKEGETGIIVKVTGQGAFRKRIVEMGFITGKKVEVLVNAPLKDPVKYRIMGYEVSLRHSEADMIEIKKAIDTEQSLSESCTCQPDPLSTSSEENIDTTNQPLVDHIIQNAKIINVALVGNPNCGKTSLFNFASGAHERVGNYSGVTVDAKEGYAEFEGYQFNIVDLPGTYSLSAYSPEELYVRKQIIEKTPDVIVNVIDTSNLERNLYLTTQLIDMHLNIVCALNMFDETEKRGDHIEYNKLGTLLGIPMIPTIFKTGKGVKELFHQVIKNYESKKNGNSNYKQIQINHGREIEEGITQIQQVIRKNPEYQFRFPVRYLCIKLLEFDKKVEYFINNKLPNAADILKERNKVAQRIKEETKIDSETAIMDAKYGFVHGALKETNYSPGHKKDTYHTTHCIDHIITNKYLGFPIFIVIIWIMFETTFTLGDYPKGWIEDGVAWLGNTIATYFPSGPIKDMLVDGVIGGVGAVIVFLPQILILYFFISYMEDSGYMARAAFIMDKLMHKMGLHGKSFIPLIMGFGCNVPAIMATRTIESRKSRLVTMLILPMMSCSARLPVYIMIIGTFFVAQYRSIVMISIYIIGILMAIILGKLFSKLVVKGEDTPFVMELPPYRFPTWKAIFRHTWEKGKQYLKKMGGIILVASIIVWALGYFPRNEHLSKIEQQEQSYIGRIGKTIEPIFSPQGFNWKLDIGIIAGVGAKEIVASTIGVLYSADDSFGDDNTYSSDTDKYTHLRNVMQSEGITPLTAYAFLLFILFYFPCVAVIAAVKGETGSWKWALFSAMYTTILAWIVSAVFYQVGRLFV